MFLTAYHVCYRLKRARPSGPDTADTAEEAPPPSWDPGETLSLPFGGAIMYCGNGTQPTPCPAGTYSATAVFGPFRSAPATFTLT